MKDVERVLGRLEEFKDMSMKHFDRIESRIDEIEQRIEDLQGFRWRFVGAMMVISFLVSGLIQIVAATMQP